MRTRGEAGSGHRGDTPTPEEQAAIAGRVDALLDALEHAEPPGREPPDREALDRLDSACRARSRGRMSPEQEERFDRILREYRAMVLDALRAGLPVPRGVRARVERPRPASWQRITLGRLAWIVALIGASLAAGRVTWMLGPVVAWVGGLSLAFTAAIGVDHREARGPMAIIERTWLFLIAAVVVSEYSAFVVGLGFLAFLLVAHVSIDIAGESRALVVGAVVGGIVATYLLARTTRWFLSWPGK